MGASATCPSATPTTLDEKNSADEQMLQIMQMCERSIHFRQLLYDTRILDIAEDLIGPNIQLFHDQALYKPAHHGGPRLLAPRQRLLEMYAGQLG